ncbi:serine carboxypeptidase [Gymnopilus junonius]|uniref:Carboxypeptidase n=1 Tax=Gymnopilus junonius TaxID=109634 RepID=A0A9P5NHX7_GYMJU|nr:serine carboxypeptidase [Gymnopilus junonius]
MITPVLSKLSTFFLCLLVLLRPVIAGQIPIVGGVLGGVPAIIPQELERVDVQTHLSTTGKLRIVENSGICETTPGVYQASGYADITPSDSLFWFFAAREDPDNAPLTLWFNGGVTRCFSMIGLFQENGPCRINNDSSSVSLNPYSWSNYSNMLYIDQPIGVGFSHGNRTVGTSQEAATDIWTFMQIFLSDSRFSKYQANNLAIWTESYGGHYGPTFASYFLAQNAAIASGSVTGITLKLGFLGIGDGITDPLIQYAGYISYAASNPYHPLVSSAEVNTVNESWTSSTGCQSQIATCYNNGNNSVCSQAQNFCNSKVLNPLAGVFDVYYVLSRNPDPYPPDITNYLASVASEIGAESTWLETSDVVYANFAMTGDWMRNSRPDVETVIDAGVRTIVYDGDADYILNFNGVEAMVDALNTTFTSLYKQQNFETYTVSGQKAGQFKNAGLFSYIRIYGAGHEVPAYKFGNLAYGQAASQFFSQIMSNQSLSSTSHAVQLNVPQGLISAAFAVSCIILTLC